MTQEELSQKLQDFVNSRKDQPAEFPNVETNQCMALMHLYEQDVLGITDLLSLAEPKAAQVFRLFPNVDGAGNYSLITNTPEAVPTEGALVFWDENEGEGAGHVAVFLRGDVNSFTSFDSNWPQGTTPHEQEHDYTNVLGWLHPLVTEEQAPGTPETPEATTEQPVEPTPQGNPYTLASGAVLDLANPESMKECANIWDAVVNRHEYVTKGDFDQVVANAGSLTEQLNSANTQLAEKDTTIQNLQTQAASLSPVTVDQMPTLKAIYEEVLNVIHKVEGQG